MKSFASLLLVSLALPLAACAGAADGDAVGVEDDATESASEEALTSGRYHFDVGNPSANWNPGCGQPRPDGQPCPFGLFFTYTKMYVDLTFTYSVSVNNNNHVITIKTDTWSNNRIHPLAMTTPQTIKINSSKIQMSQAYTVVTKNYQGRVLARDAVFTGLAP